MGDDRKKLPRFARAGVSIPRASFFALVMFAACGGSSSTSTGGGGGGGGGGGTGTAVTASSQVATGDVRMSGEVSLASGKLGLALASIRDPDDATRPADPARVSFAVAAAPAATGSTAPSLSCAVSAASSAAPRPVDLVFVDDTTSSMNDTINGIFDSIQGFTDALAAGGVDVRLAMYTYGDTFATKRSAGSEFTEGQADFLLPPAGTDCFVTPQPAGCDIALLDPGAQGEPAGAERPYLGLSTLGTFQHFLAELRSSTSLGAGGGDTPENTVGALDYASSHVAFRPGAERVYVAIGDQPSHQAGDGTAASGIPPPGWPAQFQPPTGDALVAKLSGQAVVHVVGHDPPSAAPFYNLKSLADGTGGAFFTLPAGGRVDLASLSLTDWLTRAFTGTCDGAPTGHYLLVVTATVTGSAGTVKAGTLTFDLTVS